MRPEQAHAAVRESNKIHQRGDEERVYGVESGRSHNEKTLLRKMIAVFHLETVYTTGILRNIENINPPPMHEPLSNDKTLLHLTAVCNAVQFLDDVIKLAGDQDIAPTLIQSQPLPPLEVKYSLTDLKKHF